MSRQVVVLMARAGGVPERIMSPWYRLMQDMSTMNVLADTVGRPYHRATSIPQGCPLSMAWLSLVLRPMLLLVRTCGVVPRALADDVNMYCRGHASWRRVRRASNCAHIYLKDSGSRIAHG
eukprot:6112293-Alexandrium_andersonii.AAC.1